MADSLPPVLAERVRTSRLLGSDPARVLHGGGNTSAKGQVRQADGTLLDVIWVKGSGWDLATIEAPGLPALDLERLRSLRSRETLGDEEMVREVRRALLDPSAPTPSVETLLHAFLHHAFIDHSHADAILAVSNLEDGEERCRRLFGDRLAYLPFVMPGFPLAKAVAEAYEACPSVEGVLLHQHGLFTFSDTGEDSLALHLEFIEMAEAELAQERSRMLSAVGPPNRTAAQLLPILRGAMRRQLRDAATADSTRSASNTAPSAQFNLELRQEPWILAALDQEGAEERLVSPPLTPDHSLRTKNLPCWLDLPVGCDGADLGVVVEDHLKDYVEAYSRYFERGCLAKGDKIPLDPMPRVFLIPGLGVVGVGGSPSAATIAADIAVQTLATKTVAAPLGSYRGLGELDLFDMEYWSLEQAKLGKKKPKELEGQVALITGAGGAIGEGVAQVLAEAGAAVVLADLDLAAAEACADRVGGAAMAVQMDVRDQASIQAALEATCQRFGGLDILVPNAGLAHVATIGELELEDWQRLVDVNQTGVLLSLKVGSELMQRQGCGGSIVLVSSKNVPAPGAGFGAYSASKAAAHQLARVAALELAEDGIHVNMVCPDAVFRHGENASGLWSEVGPSRAKSRGLEVDALQDFYRERNLLKTEVTAEQVGQAVLFFAARRTPTTGAWLPVDGGVAGAAPR